MEKRLVLSSRNNYKLTELKGLLSDLEIQIASLKDFPEMPPVVEDGKTFKENAAKKALAAAQFTKLLALADDSGLEVDALHGQPGVLSARFSGEGATDEANNARLLELLRDVPEGKRAARFRCAIAIATPEGQIEYAEGSCEGAIAFAPRGTNGFGYDPLFMPDGFGGRTFAELQPGEKNAISHRGRALAATRQLLVARFAV
ncbi:MAG: XTP/dITP diphosphatase [Firmicutes bacterium]|nr:XTP/dITP diphosphatase [Bacillota bacterium]